MIVDVDLIVNYAFVCVFFVLYFILLTKMKSKTLKWTWTW